MRSGGSRPSDKGRPGHPDSEIREGGGGGKQSYKNFFSALQASVGSKIKEGPPLDPQLVRNLLKTDVSPLSPRLMRIQPCRIASGQITISLNVLNDYRL